MQPYVGRLRQREHQGQAEHSKQLEIDPGVFVKVERHLKISQPYGKEEGSPSQCQLDPDRGGKFQLVTHHPLQ